MNNTIKPWTEYNRNKYGKYEEGKIKCPICDGYYKKPCSHAVQRHNITSEEFKTLLGFSKNKGILCENSLEIAKKRVYENAEVAIVQNLIEAGKQTRLKKNNKLRAGKPGKPKFNHNNL